MLNFQIEETDKFEVRRDVSQTVKADGEVLVSCPRCGQEVVLRPPSSREENFMSHHNCRITFELVPKGYDLIIVGNR